MNKEFSLYDDETLDTGIVSNTPDEIFNNDLFISVDISLGKSLYEMIEPVRLILFDKPKTNVVIYLICGKKCSTELNDFCEYLLDLDHDLNIFLRGYIHPELLKLVLIKSIKVHNKCKLVYTHKNLHQFLQELRQNQVILTNFMRRFLDHYYLLPKENLLDLTELNMIGLEIETF